MEKPEIRKRYDPLVHPDPLAYIDLFPVRTDKSLAAMTTLAAAFTPYTKALYEGLVEREDGIIIPDSLSGTFRNFQSSEAIVRYKAFGKPGNYDSFDHESFPWLYSYNASKVTSNAHDVDPKGFLYLSIPYGNFGEDTAIALVNATRALYMVVDQEAPRLAKMDPKYSQLIDRSTFYGDPAISFLDGVKSTAEAFAFLTNSSTVPGFENDPVGLFRVLIENDSFNKLGRLFMATDLPTLISASLTPVDILDPKTLTLKKDFVEGMMKRQRAYREKYPSDTLRQTDFGCPVSMHNTTLIENGVVQRIQDTGINFAARIFVEYFDYYLKQIKLLGITE